MPMTIHELAFLGGPLVGTLLVLAISVAALGLLVFARKLLASAAPDYVPAEALTRIKTDYPELPQ